MPHDVKKLAILADAAKYDASCSSSGGTRRDSKSGSGMGSITGSGICHSYAPDGRCISLLKILMTNFCIYECNYCINRNSSPVERARFSVDEVVALTLDFYQRNYIEGLFLSSGVIRDPDYTMDQLVEVARRLREDHDFRGYIHLKTIPDADGELLAAAGRYADRLSINVELPTEKALADLAPEKDHRTIKLSMARIRHRVEEAGREKAKAKIATNLTPKPKPAIFAPAGQTTQMIIGAEPSTDQEILHSASNLYASYRLRRVYYSAYSPIQAASPALPSISPPLIREHRLYQSDWLLRFYGFDAAEITSGDDDDATPGMLRLDIDPKLAWALRNRSQFPVDLNRADRLQILRVPGLGTRSVQSILRMRRYHSVRLQDLKALRCQLGKVRPFVITADHHPKYGDIDSRRLRALLTPPAEQLTLPFADTPVANRPIADVA